MTHPKLAYGWHPDPSDTIIANRGLMEKLIAARRRPPWVDPDDLRQEARIGLLTAWRKYDKRRGTKFSTVAAIWINQRIDRYIDNNMAVVHVPVPRVQRARQLYLGRLAPESMDEFDAAAHRAIHGRIDIDAEADSQFEESSPHHLHASIADDQADNPLNLAAIAGMVDDVAELLKQLPHRWEMVVRLRYGIGCRPHTGKETAEIIGRTKARTDQIRQNAERRLLKIIQRRGLREQLMA